MEEKKEEPKYIEFEDILEDVGGYGWYQKRLIWFFMVPLTLFGSLLSMNTMFMLSAPDFWCNDMSVPVDESYNSSHMMDNAQNKSINQCYVNVDTFNISNISNISDEITNQIKCSSFSYDTSNYDETAVTYFNLVCDDAHWKSFILSISSVGDVIGNPFFGYLSDKIGRHKIFFLSLSFAVSSAISPVIFRGIIMFTIFRCLASFCNSSLFNLPYISMTEIVAPSHRSILVVIGATCWTIGMCLLPLVAYIARDWILLVIAPTILIIPFFFYWKFLPESPRWLIAQKRYDEAYEIMKNIAEVNGNIVPKDLMDKIKLINSKSNQNIKILRKYSAASNGVRKDSKISENENVTEMTNMNVDRKDIEISHIEEEKEGSVFDIVKYSGLRKKFLIVTLGWTACIAVYGGLTLNFENFHGNEFVNWFLLSVVEFPSNWISWFMMETRLGRRWTHSMTLTLGGISLCLPMLLPSAYTNSVIICSMIGKCLCNVAFNVVYQQTAELFPTPVRNSGLSYASAIASAANFALPYLAALGKIKVWIPLTTIGIVAIISGIIASLLPETLNENLPQTIEDGDNFGRKFKFFSLAKVEKNKV